MAEKENSISPLKASLGAAFVASSLMAPLGQAADAGANPFAAQDLGSGYMQLAEGACGEGACGEGDNDDKDDKDREGACGEGACGEGTCGG